MSFGGVAQAGALPAPLKQTGFYDNTRPKRAKVDLGQQLFFDKILGGTKDVACATCHSPLTGTSDGLSLGLGVGARGLSVYRSSLGFDTFEEAAVNRIVRNSRALFNLGWHGWTTLMTDGDISVDPTQPSGFASPLGEDFPVGLDNLLAAQNMLPAAQPREMAGTFGDNEVTLAAKAGDMPLVWDLLAARVAGIDEYVRQFVAVFDDVDSADDITFVHIANAMAAYQIYYFTAFNSPFDQYLRGNKAGMNGKARNGMNLFYGKAGCDTCHSGPMLTDQEFYAISIPQIGPGRAAGTGGEDKGRERISRDWRDKFKYATPSLRNVALTGPYGHDGAYGTLEAVIRHHLDPLTALEEYDTSQALLPDSSRWGADDFVEHENLSQRAERAARNQLQPIELTDKEVNELVAFMHALTDPKSIDLRHTVPMSVPSGLPVWD